jgi:hypothetical protein
MTEKRRVSRIEVLPSKISYPSYFVTLTQAEQMVARGAATWIPGLNKVRELTVKARGTAREWRKVSSNGCAVMQLVEPKSSRDYMRLVRKSSTKD